MATKNDTETPTVLRKLSAFVLLFYFIYYLLSILLVGSFSVDWLQLGRFPFRTGLEEFNPHYNGADSNANKAALGAWLAMVLTFMLSLALCYWVVRVTRRSWDYLATTSVLHWVLCCCGGFSCPNCANKYSWDFFLQFQGKHSLSTVERSFPTGWVWWVTLLAAVLLTSCSAELIIYQLRDLREIQLPQ